MQRMNFNKKLALVHIIPLLFAILAATCAYIDFSQNGITPPTLWTATFLAGFFLFAELYLISMTIFLWRYT